MSQHTAALYNYARRFFRCDSKAQEAVQNTFISLWKSRHRYQDDNGLAFCYFILKRRIVDIIRQRNNRWITRANLDYVEQPTITPTSADYSDLVLKALNTLDPNIRDAFLLVSVHKHTHNEASKKLNIPLGTVLSRVNRARSKLYKLLYSEAGLI